MKTLTIWLATVLLTACAWAQAPQAPQPMHQHNMGAMHDQHMAAVKTDIAKMRATLDEMKATIGNEKKTKEQQLEQKNIELWDSMIKHMEGMVQMMEKHEGMGMMGGGEGHGMSCCAGMKEGMKEGGCCGGMKDGGGCCGGGKCEKQKPAAPGE